MSVIGDQNMKKDAGKLRWSLYTWKAAEWVVRVLEFGAKKYAAHAWRNVDNAIERYTDAAQRHLVAYQTGEILDPESGLPHLAHLSCCVNFLLELDKRHSEPSRALTPQDCKLWSNCAFPDGHGGSCETPLDAVKNYRSNPTAVEPVAGQF